VFHLASSVPTWLNERYVISFLFNSKSALFVLCAADLSRRMPFIPTMCHLPCMPRAATPKGTERTGYIQLPLFPNRISRRKRLCFWKLIPMSWTMLRCQGNSTLYPLRCVAIIVFTYLTALYYLAIWLSSSLGNCRSSRIFKFCILLHIQWVPIDPPGRKFHYIMHPLLLVLFLGTIQWQRGPLGQHRWLLKISPQLFPDFLRPVFLSSAKE
jgi:hypothetical protein